MAEEIVALNMQQLDKCVRELALPANEQMTLYPDFVNVAYELADNFGNWCNWALSSDQVMLSPVQRSQLQALNDLLSAWSNIHNEAMWTDEALATAGEWQEVRERARELLRTPLHVD